MKSNEVQKLLKNISKALEHYSVPEFNNYLTTAIYKKDDTSFAQDYILSIVCQTYNITLSNLLNSKSNQSITKARRVAFCILHYTLGLSTRYIANNIFKFKYHSAVGDAIKRYKEVNLKVKTDKEFKDDIDEITKKVLIKINSENKPV
jgi:hypothetical protein